MKSVTAAPVGLQLESSLMPALGNANNAVMANAANLPEQYSQQPIDIENSLSQLSQLTDLTNKNLQYQYQPQLSSLRDAMNAQVSNQYIKDTAPGAGDAENTQLTNQAMKNGLQQVFNSGVGPDASAGRATLQNNLVGGELGAQQYQRGLQSQDLAQSQGLLQTNPLNQYAANPEDLQNFAIQQGENQVNTRNNAVQSLLGRDFSQNDALGQTVTNAAGQLQTLANNNAAAANAANGQTLGLIGSGIGAAGYVGGSALL